MLSWFVPVLLLFLFLALEDPNAVPPRVIAGVPRVLDGTLPEHLKAGEEKEGDWGGFAQCLETTRFVPLDLSSFFLSVRSLADIFCTFLSLSPGSTSTLVKFSLADGISQRREEVRRRSIHDTLRSLSPAKIESGAGTVDIKWMRRKI